MMNIAKHIAIVVALGWGVSAQAQETRDMLPNLGVQRMMPNDELGLDLDPYSQPLSPIGARGSETTDEREGMLHAPAAVTAVGGVNPIPRVPVILVGFNDWAFQTPKAYFDSLFNGKDWSNQFGGKSISRYFHDCSNGAYQPTFDVYGPVTIDGSVYGYRNSDANIVKMACEMVDDSVDFSLYDYNHDNKIDLVFYIFAGYGCNEGNILALMQNPPVSAANRSKLIWPHYVANGASGKGTYDGKALCDYEASNELDAMMARFQELGYDWVELAAGNGTATHEFCHALGLPDLYNTGSGSQVRIGSWDIMDQGTYNNYGYGPAGLSAWERWWMGWIEPERLTTACHDTLPALMSSNKAYYIASSDITNPRINNGVFYTLENRQAKGWDRYLPGHGMLVTRIQYKNATWQGSNNTTPYAVIPVLASTGATGIVSLNENTGEYGLQSDLFPAGATSCEALELSNIAEQNDTIVFDYKGGTPTADPYLQLFPQEGQESKRIVNGKVVIKHGNTLYDLRGNIVCHEAPERRNIPAYPGIIEKVDADGDTIHIRMKGDERKHWTITEDGYEIKHKDGRFYYVDKNGKLSKRKAKDADKRSCCDKRWIKRHMKL